MAAQFECLLPCGVDKQWQCFGLLVPHRHEWGKGGTQKSHSMGGRGLPGSRDIETLFSVDLSAEADFILTAEFQFPHLLEKASFVYFWLFLSFWIIFIRCYLASFQNFPKY